MSENKPVKFDAGYVLANIDTEITELKQRIDEMPELIAAAESVRGLKIRMTRLDLKDKAGIDRAAKLALEIETVKDRVECSLKTLKQAANKLHKSITGKESEHLKPFDELREKLDAKIKEFALNSDTQALESLEEIEGDMPVDLLAPKVKKIETDEVLILIRDVWKGEVLPENTQKFFNAIVAGGIRIGRGGVIEKLEDLIAIKESGLSKIAKIIQCEGIFGGSGYQPFDTGLKISKEKQVTIKLKKKEANNGHIKTQ